MVSIIGLPRPGHEDAPKKFKGSYEEVERFIDHYEQLLDAAGITEEKEKCLGVRKYCSTRVANIIETFDGNGPQWNWATLRDEIKLRFDADRASKRYHLADLHAFLEKSQKKKITTTAAFKQYDLNFRYIWTHLSAPKPDDSQKFTYYWLGIGLTLRERIEDRFLRTSPGADMSNPIPMRDVYDLGIKVLSRDRFDTIGLAGMVGADDEDDDQTEEGSDWRKDLQEDSESDESDSALAFIKKQKLKGKLMKAIKAVRFEAEDSSDEEPKSKPSISSRASPRHQKSSSVNEKVAALIEELAGMSRTDKRYPSLYYRATTLDGKVKDLIPAPIIASAVQVPSSGGTSSAQTTFERQSPPHLGTAGGAPAARPPLSEMLCYGCGKKGHGMNRCTEIDEKIKSGIIVRDATNRLMFADGSFIRRNGSESFMDAIKRREEETKTFNSHFVKRLGADMCPDEFKAQLQQAYFAPEGHPSAYIESETDSDSESDGEPEYWTMPAITRAQQKLDDGRRQTRNKIYPSPDDRQRARKQRRQREREDEELVESHARPAQAPSIPGERPLSSKREGKRKADEPIAEEPGPQPQPQPEPAATITPEPATAITPEPVPMSVEPELYSGKPRPVAEDELTEPPVRKSPRKKDKKRLINPGGEELPTLTPLQTRPSDYDAEEDDDILPDISPRPPSKTEGQRLVEKRAYNPHKSAVSSEVDPKGVVDRILKTPVSSSVGELMGLSKELSQILSDTLKFRPQKEFVDLKNINPKYASGNLAPAQNNKAGDRMDYQSFIAPRVHGELIRLRVDCYGYDINAILDTGSELNVVSSEVFEQCFRLPKDMDQHYDLGDANGGKQTLAGVVKNVKLKCGAIETVAHFCISERPPFDILLGRPWQRGNYVTIDERNDGTYLQFKDPRDRTRVKYELMAEPDETRFDRRFDQRSWAAHATPQGNTYMGFLLPSEETMRRRARDMFVLPVAVAPRQGWDEEPAFVEVGGLFSSSLEEFNLMSVQVWERTGLPLQRYPGMYAPSVTTPDGEELTWIGRVNDVDTMMVLGNGETYLRTEHDYFVMDNFPIQNAGVMLGLAAINKWNLRSVTNTDGSLSLRVGSIPENYRYYPLTVPAVLKRPEDVARRQFRSFLGLTKGAFEAEGTEARFEDLPVTEFWFIHRSRSPQPPNKWYAPELAAIDTALERSIISKEGLRKTGLRTMWYPQCASIQWTRGRDLYATEEVDGEEGIVTLRGGGSHVSASVDMLVVKHFPYRGLDFVLGQDWMEAAGLAEMSSCEERALVQFENGLFVQIPTRTIEREPDYDYPYDELVASATGSTTDVLEAVEGKPEEEQILPVIELWCLHETVVLQTVLSDVRPIRMAVDVDQALSSISAKGWQLLGRAGRKPRTDQMMISSDRRTMEVQAIVSDVRLEARLVGARKQLGSIDLRVVEDSPYQEVECVLGNDWVKSSRMMNWSWEGSRSVLRFQRLVGQRPAEIHGGIIKPSALRNRTGLEWNEGRLDGRYVLPMHIPQGPPEDWRGEAMFRAGVVVERKLGAINLMLVDAWERTGRGVYRPTSLRLPTILGPNEDQLMIVGRVECLDMYFEDAARNFVCCGSADFLVVINFPYKNASLIVGGAWADRWGARAEETPNGLEVSLAQLNLRKLTTGKAIASDREKVREYIPPWRALWKVQSRVKGCDRVSSLEQGPPNELSARPNCLPLVKLEMTCDMFNLREGAFLGAFQTMEAAIDTGLEHSLMSLAAWGSSGRAARRPQEIIKPLDVYGRGLDVIGRVDNISLTTLTNRGKRPVGQIDAWIVSTLPLSNVQIVLGRDWVGSARLRDIQTKGEGFHLTFSENLAVPATWEIDAGSVKLKGEGSGERGDAMEHQERTAMGKCSFADEEEECVGSADAKGPLEREHSESGSLTGPMSNSSKERWGVTATRLESRVAQYREEGSVSTLADSDFYRRTSDAQTQSNERRAVEKAEKASEASTSAFAKPEGETGDEQWSTAATYAESEVSDCEEKGKTRDLADSDGDAPPGVARIQGNKRVSTEVAEQGQDAQANAHENSNEHVQEEKEGPKADVSLVRVEKEVRERKVSAPADSDAGVLPRIVRAESHEQVPVEETAQGSELELLAPGGIGGDSSEGGWSGAATYAESRVSGSDEKSSVRDLADSDDNALPNVAGVVNREMEGAEAAEQRRDAQGSTHGSCSKHVRKETGGLKVEQSNHDIERRARERRVLEGLGVPVESDTDERTSTARVGNNETVGPRLLADQEGGPELDEGVSSDAGPLAKGGMRELGEQCIAGGEEEQVRKEGTTIAKREGRERRLARGASIKENGAHLETPTQQSNMSQMQFNQPASTHDSTPPGKSNLEGDLVPLIPATVTTGGRTYDPHYAWDAHESRGRLPFDLMLRSLAEMRWLRERGGDTGMFVSGRAFALKPAIDPDSSTWPRIFTIPEGVLAVEGERMEGVNLVVYAWDDVQMESDVRERAIFVPQMPRSDIAAGKSHASHSPTHSDTSTSFSLRSDLDTSLIASTSLSISAVSDLVNALRNSTSRDNAPHDARDTVSPYDVEGDGKEGETKDAKETRNEGEAEDEKERDDEHVMYEVWAERDATTGTYRLVRTDGEQLATSEEALRLMLDAPVVEYHINGWGSGPGGFQALTKEAAARPEPILRPLIDVLNFYFFHHPNDTRYPFALEAHDHIGALNGLLGRPSTPPLPRVHHNTPIAKSGDSLTLVRVYIEPPYFCSFVFSPATRDNDISEFVDSLVATRAWFRIPDPPSDPKGVTLRPRNRLSAMDHLARALDIYFMGKEWEDAEVCLEVQEMDGEVEWERPTWIMDTDIWVRKNSEEGKVYRVRLREFIEEYPLSDPDDDLVRGRERNVFEEAFKRTVDEVQRGRRRERDVGVNTGNDGRREGSEGFTRLMEMTMRELEEGSTSEESSTPSLETISDSDYAESSESAATSFSSDSHLDALATQLAPRYPELVNPEMFPSDEANTPGLPEMERLVMLTQRAMPLLDVVNRSQPNKTTSDHGLLTPPESANGEHSIATAAPPFGVSTYGVSHYLPDRFVRTELQDEEVDGAGARISGGKRGEIIEFLEGRTAERLRGGRASSEASAEVEIVETMVKEKEIGVKQSRRTVTWMDDSPAVSGWDVYGFPANERIGSAETIVESDDWYVPPRTQVYYLERPKVLPYALAPLFDQEAYWVDEDVDQVLAAQKEYWDAGVVRCRIRKVTEVECSRFEATEWKPLADYWCGVEAAYDKDVVDMTGVEEARRPTIPVAHFPTYTQSRLFNPHYLQETSLGAHRGAHLLEHHARRSDLAIYPQFPVITNPRAPFNINWVAYLYLRQLHKYRYEKFVASISWKDWQDMEKYGESLIGRRDRFETHGDLEDYLQGKNPFFRADERRDLFFYVEYLQHRKVRTLAYIIDYILSIEVGDAALIRYLNDRGFLDGDAKLGSFDRNAERAT